MIFDWLSFLQQERIEYFERGRNVARGHVNVKCPFCGNDDPSHHMGLELETGKWGCYRDRSHRGIKPQRLIVALKRCTWAEANALATDSAIVEEASWAELKSRLESGGAVQEQSDPETITLPKNFHTLNSKGVIGRFWKYLVRKRGFKNEHIPKLCRLYNLRASLVGKFAFRVIFPLYYEDQIVGWTGRAIGRSDARYMTEPPGDSVVQRVVWNHQNARTGGRLLVICEGPMDALKVDFFGRRLGIRAVALMSTSSPAAKLRLIRGLVDRFDRTVVVLDQGAMRMAQDLKERLSAPSVEVSRLPDGIKDPGDMTRGQVRSHFIPLLPT